MSDLETMDPETPVPFLPAHLPDDALSDKSDRELLLMVVAWQRDANAAIAGIVEKANGLLDNPMLKQFTGAFE